MDQLVVEGESVVGGQAPVAAAQEKNVCGTCGSRFTNQSNLKRHVETKHTDQTTPEAAAKRLKLKEYRKNHRRNRVNDPVYREKQQQVDRTYRANKKAAGGADADASSATGIAEAEKNAAAEKKAAGEKEAEAEKEAVGIAKAEEDRLVRQAILYASRGGKANPKWRKSPARKETMWTVDEMMAAGRGE